LFEQETWTCGNLKMLKLGFKIKFGRGEKGDENGRVVVFMW